jgi:HD-GYP domain-containing protein (c-di-GMP phosphodiesterase class II)
VTAAIDEIRHQTGRQFDPEVVDAFLSVQRPEAVPESRPSPPRKIASVLATAA